ncbi:MAG: hypothetical protein ACP5DX_15640 [Paracoccaceae bacterium]
MEHEVLRATIRLLGGPPSESGYNSAHSKKFIEIAKQGFKGRLGSFQKLYEEQNGQDRWIADFASEVEMAIKLRDFFAHGIWEKTEDNQLRCRFFSRDAIKNGTAFEEAVFSVDDIRNLATTNLQTAKHVIETFGTSTHNG